MPTNSPVKKSKWTKTHKIIFGVLAGLFILSLIIPKKSESSSGNEVLTEMQKDSVARKKVIDRLFSVWDGSNYKLVAYVKKNMQDPKSFEHVSTKYWVFDKTNTIVIKMQYRGKNSFNAVVMERVKATVNIEGELLEVKED